MHTHSRAGGLIVSSLIALTALPCHASLGRAPSEFGNAGARQAQTMAAAKAGAPGWNVNVSRLDNGTTVREYVANGVVFAVSWKGPFLPDLRELLGAHFDTLKTDTAQRPLAGNAQVRIARPDVTIESRGHMRAFAGRAWINSLLPAGFDTGAIE